MPDLKKFIGWIVEERIRDNMWQASGWLIVLGHMAMVEDSVKSYSFDLSIMDCICELSIVAMLGASSPVKTNKPSPNMAIFLRQRAEIGI